MGHCPRPTAQGSERMSPNRPEPETLPAVSIWRCESSWQAPLESSGILRRRFGRPHGTRLARCPAAQQPPSLVGPSTPSQSRATLATSGL